MKKLMFTAIALVAFSSASMANTIADEEVKSPNDIEMIIKNCAKEAATKAAEFETALEAATHTCLSSSDYNQLYNFYYNECKG